MIVKKSVRKIEDKAWKMTMDNIGLAVLFATKRLGRAGSMDFDDGLQEAILGLHKGVCGYISRDIDHVKLSTYVEYRMRSKFSDYYKSKERLSVPSYITDLINTSKRNLATKNREAVVALVEKLLPPRHCDTMAIDIVDYAESVNGDSFVDCDTCEAVNNHDNIQYNAAAKKIISCLLKTLSNEDKKIVKMYFGFGGIDCMIATEIAKKLKRKPKTIRDRIKKIIAKFQDEISNNENFFKNKDIGEKLEEKKKKRAVWDKRYKEKKENAQKCQKAPQI